MKKFKFKLDAVLKMRQRLEDDLKKQLADLKNQLGLEIALLSKLQHDKSYCQEELKIRRQKNIDINKITFYESYLEVLGVKIENQVVRVSECKSEVEGKRLELLEASKEKKAVEKLYDKKYDEHMSTLRKIEQKMIDELSTMRYTRQANGAK